jgi:hypothetical protein
MKTNIVRSGLMAAAALAALLLAPLGAAAQAVKGKVMDGASLPVAGVTVYLVPGADVAKMKKAPSFDIRRNVSDDEPMEDNLAGNRDKYAQGQTDAKGNFSIVQVADGRYYVYAEPTGTTYLPGGNLSNKSMTAAELRARPLEISLSGNIPANATFVGSTECLECHEEQGKLIKTAHKLGIQVVGKTSKLQDPSRFPGINDGLKFLQAGATFYLHGYDKSRGFDKYLVGTKAPADPATLSFTATFYNEGGKLMLRTENARDPADKPRVYPVDMTYGGAVYKQRYLLRVGNATFPFLQYNPEGRDDYADRTRKPWRDYHGDWLFNETTGKLADPPKSKSFEIQCASCHYAGYSLTPTVEGGFIAGAANDVGGEADIDGDGVNNELNLGCETCHGAGSAHAKAKNKAKPSLIVSPGRLAAERATVICTQCHSRPQGTMNNDQPINKDNRMLTPGISRNEYLVNHTTREDAAQKDFWADGVHSKSHHQQGTDLIRSKHYANEYQTLSCNSCHDPHGDSGLKHQLLKPVRDGKDSLCATCHKVDLKEHTTKTVGEAHTKDIACVDCHMTKTMQTGAGLGKGIVGAGGKNYWMNDISSHLFDVPRITNKAVKGVEPGKAMPNPYTNACGESCHKAEKIPTQ